MSKITNAKLELQNYCGYGISEKKSVFIPEKVKNIEVSYDGGRFTLCINGEEIYKTMSFGNDGNVTVTLI